MFELVKENKYPDATMSIWKEEREIGHRWRVIRHVFRGNVKNKMDAFEYISLSGECRLLPLNEEKCNEILDRIDKGDPYSSCFIFHDEKALLDLDMTATPMEHKYTSTGIKFWRHKEQMFNYKDGHPGSVISTHISPEGKCNLKCPYCSVTYRDTHQSIELDIIKDYVNQLADRGLKAVILTGGGEPTIYKHFNELVQWIKWEKGLNVALITNGTNKRIDPRTVEAFSWVRVSINIFKGWEDKIFFDPTHLQQASILGCSMVYTSEHEALDDPLLDRLEILKKAQTIANRMQAKYVRLLPNCLLQQRELLLQHRSLDITLNKLGDDRFFHQHKVHGAPKCTTCHQAYFRPYLSEEIHVKTGKPGTVYPCDSVVLNEGYQHFAEKYQICHASEVGQFLDREIEMQFDPRTDCTGCVFTENVNMLDDYVNNVEEKFIEYQHQDMKHEDFV